MQKYRSLMVTLELIISVLGFDRRDNFTGNLTITLNLNSMTYLWRDSFKKIVRYFLINSDDKASLET